MAKAKRLCLWKTQRRTAKRMDTSPQYGQLPGLPLQLQDWWWQAVCGPNNWSAALCHDKNGRLQGLMPYCLTRRWGMPVSMLPPFTSYAGPWLAYPPDEDVRLSSRYSLEDRVMKALTDQLPRPWLFTQTLHPAVTNVLPFHRAGFSHTIRYTYWLEPVQNIAEAIRSCKNALRLKLHKADRATFVRRDEAAAMQVLHLHHLSMQRKGLAAQDRRVAFARLHTALLEREQCAVWLALDRHTRAPHAGLYLAFDERQATALLAGFDPLYRAYAAPYALYRTAIEFCAERRLVLDFDGGQEAGVGAVFRAFEACMVPFFEVRRGTNRLLEGLLNAWRR